MDGAARTADIKPFYVMELLARARALEADGRDIVHMEIGEPDFPTSQPVLAAAQAAIAQGDIHYTPAVGLVSLRRAIAAFYAQRYGVSVGADRVVVTPGASGALLLTLATLVNPGEYVLLADPGYPCNRNFVRLLEGQTQSVPVYADTGYQLTAELVETHWTSNTRAVLLATPANPTGTVVRRDELKRISDHVLAQGGSLIVDEIYHGLIYDGEDFTALALSDQLFVINSFSKYFGMTGWRIGWVIAPEQYVSQLDKLAQNLFLAAPTVSQYAAVAAFAPENIAILESRRAEFQQRRDYLLPALRELGFDIPLRPQGAFYIYAGCRRFSSDSYAFALDLLEGAGVAITPGIDFGDNEPNTHVRFAYTTSIERLREGVRRLAAYLK